MRIADALGVTLTGVSMIGAATAYGQIDTRSQYGGTTAAVVDDKGNLRVPADYRTAYQVLGTWAVAKDDGPGSKQLHVVYASPGTIDAYRKGGHFPDGAVLVKEVFKTTTKDMTTGTVSSAGTLAGWFVMLKDNVGRFEGNKLWGDGWVGPGSTQLIRRRLRPPTTRRTASPLTSRRDSQTGSTLAAIRS
jgi:hypothetical protein